MILGFVAIVLWTPRYAHAQPETLTIAAANSLRDALRKILPLFEAEHPGITVRVIYGPSQTLRKQIEEGAPVDVFLPSLFEEIEQLEKKDLVIQGTKRVYAGTSLVLITGAMLPAPIDPSRICTRFLFAESPSATQKAHRWGKSPLNF